jgi:hypothetical protein
MDCLSISCVPFCCTTCVKSSPSQGSKVVGASRRMLAWLEDVDIAREDVPDIEAVHAQRNPTLYIVSTAPLCNQHQPTKTFESSEKERSVVVFHRTSSSLYFVVLHRSLCVKQLLISRVIVATDDLDNWISTV